MAVVWGALLLASLGLWVRGIGWVDWFAWFSWGQQTDRAWMLYSTARGIGFIAMEDGVARPNTGWRASWHPLRLIRLSAPIHQVYFQSPQWSYFGGPVVLNARAGGPVGGGFVVPHWVICAVWSVLLGRSVIRLHNERQRARAPTTCRTCGYDLRSGHERCPECGGESHIPVTH